MTDIGTLLKCRREENGVSVEEAAEDLGVKPSQINNIEAGDMKSFKDVFYLKFFIRDYAKYLGLDYDKVVDDFNEFLFDYTSRIPTEAIEEKSKEKKEEDKKKVVSPYTIETVNYFDKYHLTIYGIVLFILLIVGYLVFTYFI